MGDTTQDSTLSTFETWLIVCHESNPHPRARRRWDHNENTRTSRCCCFCLRGNVETPPQQSESQLKESLAVLPE